MEKINVVLSKIDVELLENHNLKISEIENNKKNQIIDELKQRIVNLTNLINDEFFIDNISDYVPLYLESGIGLMLYHFSKDWKNTEKYVIQDINNFIDEYGLNRVLDVFDKHEKEIKKYYLKNLNKSKEIRVK